MEFHDVLRFGRTVAQAFDLAGISNIVGDYRVSNRAFALIQSILAFFAKVGLYDAGSILVLNLSSLRERKTNRAAPRRPVVSC